MNPDSPDRRLASSSLATNRRTLTITERLQALHLALRNHTEKVSPVDWGEKSFNDKGFTER
jgi:hypothetical protein